MDFEGIHKKNLENELSAIKSIIEQAVHGYEYLHPADLFKRIERCQVHLNAMYAVRKDECKKVCRNDEDLRCPECGELMFTEKDKREDNNPPNYCFYCGQHLDFDLDDY